MKIKIINGANLNMLGYREEIYGDFDLQQMNDEILEYAVSLGVEIEFFQSNYEGAIIEEIHRTINGYDGLIINPAAYSHYSYAIADALAILQIPKVEVHLTDIEARESFRAISLTARQCNEMICGKSILGYKQAINSIIERCKPY